MKFYDSLVKAEIERIIPKSAVTSISEYRLYKHIAQLRVNNHIQNIVLLLGVLAWLMKI